MTKREILKKALEFEETPLVPYCLDFTQKAYDKLVEYYGVEDVYGMIGNFIAMTEAVPPDYWSHIKPGFYADEFGVIWNRTVDKDIGVVDNCLFPAPALDGYEFPDPLRPDRFAHIPEFIHRNRDKYILCGIGFSLFERAWTMRGMENLLVDMMEHPDFVHDLLDAILEFNLNVIKEACKFEIDGFRLGDDWGCQRGLIMGPRSWQTFLKPRLAKMYGAVHEAGKKVFIHSCGKVQEVFPELIEIGLDVFNPFQPEVMDIYEMKRAYYGKLAFFGGISVQKLLPYGTPDEVRSEVRRILKEIGRGGGYIAAPSHAVPGDAPVENLVAMIDAVRGQWRRAENG